MVCGGEWWVVVSGGGGVPSDYFVSTQLQLRLFCCWGWGCGYCWAVTIWQKHVIDISLKLRDSHNGK